MDLVIRGGTIVTDAETFAADVAVRDGLVAAVEPDGDWPASETIDARGCYVFPGFIDAHVHLSLPIDDLVSTDDFHTGTVAAACGGTTTVIDFVHPERSQPLAEAVALRRAEADGRIVVDYGLHVAITDASPARLAEIPALVQAGYTSFKLYTAYDTVMLDDAGLLAALFALAEHRGFPLVHCENHGAATTLTRRLLAAGRTDPTAHPLARPPAIEAEATNRVLLLARIAQAPVCIAHLTCRESLAALVAAQDRGQLVYAETCPQYLLLSDQDYDRPNFEGAKYVLSPPLRDSANHDVLWQALADTRRDAIQMVSTDHCPWDFVGQKDRGRDDFSRIPGGAPGIETRIPLLYSEGVGAGRLTLNRFVAVCAANPARLFGLYPRKGTVQVGSDADLVIFDPAWERTLSRPMLHQRVDYTPYEGWAVQGYPRTVLSRGRVMVRDGEFVGEAGDGRFVARGLSAAFAMPTR
jgi:dihydropyrimidinase